MIIITMDSVQYGGGGHLTGLPGAVIVGLTGGVVPDQLSTSVVGDGVLVVSDAVSFVIQEFAVFGGPSDLHDTRSDNQSFVEPSPVRHLECASDAFERRHVASSLQFGMVIPLRRSKFEFRKS